jgi:lambda family phage portal protein
VGRGIEAKAVAETRELARDAERVWREWSGSVTSDFDGRMPFKGMQRLVMESVAESGECLIVRERASSRDGLPVPVRIRVLEPDFLDVDRDGINGARGPIVQGVEHDDRGHRVAYWLFGQHPGASRRFGSTASKRVSARDVLHVYRVERPSQVRGIPWLATAISELNDFDDYEDAVLMQQKIAACFGAFVSDYDSAVAPLGEQDPDDPLLETLEPGQIQYLPPGKTISFATPPVLADSSFTSRNLHRIAASLGVTFEDLTGDYSQVNFSSARMARLSHWSNVQDWRFNMLIPQFCDQVWRWVMEPATAANGWPAIPQVRWAPPPMPMLEPDKEGIAFQRHMRAGTRTLFQILRELGEDPEAHLAEIAAVNERLDELGIVLDSDPRKTTTSGQGQASDTPSEDAPSGSNGANGSRGAWVGKDHIADL